MRKGWWGLIAAILLWGTMEPKAAPAPLQAVPTIPNLMAHWGFEEAAGGPSMDGSGNGNTGTHVGTPGVGAASPFPGSVQGLTFSQAGTTRVDVPDSPSTSPTGSFTLAAWINVSDTANQQGILEKWIDTNPGGGYFLRVNASEYLGFTIFSPTGVATGISTAPRVIPLGSWVHVAGTYDGTTMRMYVDGTVDPTTGPSTPPGDTTSPLRLGRDFGANGLNGTMDEARIYNKALSAGEISILRLGQAPVTGVVATPGPGEVYVGWVAPAAVPGVTVTYAVLSGPSAMGPWSIESQGIAGTSHTVSGLPTTPIYFQVIAVSVVASSPATSGSATPTSPPVLTPHTTDHDEGILDGKCECGTVRGAGMTALWAGLALAIGAILAARRR